MDNYAVSCDSETYLNYLVPVCLGIVICSVGFPLLSFLIIYKADYPLFEKAADNYLVNDMHESAKYFELYNTIRKFIIVSCTVFVSDYASSKFIFMLTVNCFWLLFLLNTQPYTRYTDYLLNQMFLVVECFVFLVFLILSADIDKTDHMSGSKLQNSVYVVIFSTLIISFVSLTKDYFFQVSQKVLNKEQRFQMKQSSNEAHPRVELQVVVTPLSISPLNASD